MDKEKKFTDKNHDHSNVPYVSVCCITYNHEKYIAEAIEGFLMQQTTFPFEIIIHDDASTDKTAEIIQSYERKFPHLIKAVIQKENQYSKGIKSISATFVWPRARGKYIALCEGDDYWTDPYKLQKQIDYLENNPKCTLCTHDTETIFLNSHGIKHKTEFHGSAKFSLEDVLLSDKTFNVGHTSSMVFPKWIVEDIPNWYFDAPTGDIALKILCASKGYGFYINETMSAYRSGVADSWSERVLKDPMKLIRHLSHLIDMLDSFNKESNGQFSDIVSTCKRKYEEQLISTKLKYIEFDNLISKIRKIIMEKNMTDKQIGIFGVGEMGIKVKNRLQEQGINITVFLDNFPSREEIEGIKVIKPSQEKIKELNLEIIIHTVLGNHYLEIEKQLAEYSKKIKVISVREVAKNL